MKEDHHLAEILGILLITDQVDNVKNNVVWIFANIMAEPD